MGAWADIMARRRRKPAPVGGLKRTLLFAGVGVVCLLVAAACFALSWVVRPSSGSGSIIGVTATLDGSNLTTSRAEAGLLVNPSARYDFYLTAPTADVSSGDYCSIDIEAHRGEESRYLTYTYTSFGSNVVRKRRMGREGTETYEMDRNVHISSRAEEVRLVFNTTSAWFASMQPTTVQIEIVEVTPIDRVLLVGTSVLQVIAFPVAFAGILLLWLALMRQMRLFGVLVTPPGKFRPMENRMAPAEGGDS